MKGHLKIQLATLVAGLVFVANATAQEWPRFRGPNGTGISLAKGIPSKFALADADWRVSLKGEGHSSPVLWGDRIFVTGYDSNSGATHLQCLKAGDGSELWSVSRPQAKHRTHRYNHLASASPATDGNCVVVVTSESEAHHVIAYSISGKKLWEKKFPTIISNHGGGISPVLYDGKVILAGDEDNQSFLAALDAKNGNLIWKVDRINAKAAFSTPCEFTDRSGTKGLVI